MKAIFLTRKKKMCRKVYPEDVIARLRERVELDGTVYDKDVFRIKG